ncbi:hypothetical protein L1987_58049 [Smallanthus sonchifolius]|uniref:Uncharacterized protein n=1 Tax=Smallanthus sonchifolius TaxID=185202 RepID=A0ACB9DEP7_9ASTR|nr:hypothetical protein L1987_58049 [Smallanthus sonchifolius]
MKTSNSTIKNFKRVGEPRGYALLLSQYFAKKKTPPFKPTYKGISFPSSSLVPNPSPHIERENSGERERAV